MGRQPRSGDIPWLSAHSILNWIGGDTYYPTPLRLKVKWGNDRIRSAKFRSPNRTDRAPLAPAAIDMDPARVLILLVLQPSLLSSQISAGQWTRRSDN
jgi:hypothetical protein